MDFLDPKKIKSYKIKLVVGYFLIAAAVILGTVILVYAANGYGFNTKSGQIVQNGLLFVDGKPSGSKISLSGQSQLIKFPTRQVLPAGSYSMRITKDGYKDWLASFDLGEQTIKRFNYVFMFPVQPVETVLKTYSAKPDIVTESPDRRWLIVSAGSNQAFDVYDANDPTKVPSSISVPSDTLSSVAEGNMQALGWTSDNNKLLVRHDFGSSSEFILIDRQKPDQSINLNRLFNLNPSAVALFPGKSDKVYLYNTSDKTLKIANIATPAATEQTIKNVISYKPLDSGLLLYVSSLPSSDSVEVSIFDSGKSYHLANVKSQATYYIDASQYQGHWFYALSTSSGSLTIYEDPLDNLRSSSSAKTSPLGVLSLPSIKQVSISSNGRNLIASNGKDFAVYDFENLQKTKFSLTAATADNFGWMDNYHIFANQDGHMIVADYDGANQTQLSLSSLFAGGYFARDYKHAYTLQQGTGNEVEFVAVDLRAGADLPK